MQDWKLKDQIARPENAGLENDGLEFDRPEQRAVMSQVPEHHAQTKDRSDFLMQANLF